MDSSPGSPVSVGGALDTFPAYQSNVVSLCSLRRTSLTSNAQNLCYITSFTHSACKKLCTHMFSGHMSFCFALLPSIYRLSSIILSSAGGVQGLVADAWKTSSFLSLCRPILNSFPLISLWMSGFQGWGRLAVMKRLFPAVVNYVELYRSVGTHCARSWMDNLINNVPRSNEPASPDAEVASL